MPRRKSHRHRPEPEDGTDGSEDGVQNGTHDVEDLFELLLEQRYTTREAALKSLAKTLCTSYSFDIIDKWRTTITEGLQKSFKKGRDTEKQLAAQALSLIVLTLGAESDDIFSEFQPLLSSWVKDFQDGTAAPVLNEALTTLAMLYFVSCEDELATRDYLALLELVMGSDAVALHTNAVRSWTLLLTTVPSTYIISKVFPKNIQTLFSLLDAKDVDTRVAVGESIAFLLDVMRQSVESREETFDLHAYDKHVNTDDLLEKIKEFSFSTNRQSAKKDRQKQKGFFKEIMQSIENGETPEEVLTINDQKITFEGWKQHIQLNFVRGCLAEGTQLHLESNSLLHEIFDYQLSADGGKQTLSKVEKRLFMSPNSSVSKARTKARNVDRDNFSRAGSFATEDM